jgi:4-amino-4-deoxy-L-arabinose transferase-like glycosyltransferase
MSPAVAPAHRATWLLLLVVLVIWCSNLEYRKLVRPDEGRYAEIPRYMAVSGDWLTPRLNGIKYFEKPPLQYWMTAAAFEAFGEHHWTARLWPALTGFLGILAVAFAGVRLFGRETGFDAAVVLGGSMGYAAIAHVNTLDMGVTFFLTVALMSFLLAQQSGAPPGTTRMWMHVVWAALALAVLSKGLIGLVLPGGTLVLYSLIHRDLQIWRRLHLVTGIILFLLISAPWFIAVSLVNPEFPWFFFVHEHFLRYATTAHRRVQPWFYFVPILIAGMIPWVVTMVDALARTWRNEAGSNEFKPQRFLLLWAAFTFGFFSLSDSKLPSYILPMFPALALLIAVRLRSIGGRALAWHSLPIALIALAGLIMAPEVVRLADVEVPIALYQAYVPWLIGATAVMAVACGYAMSASCRGHMRHAVIALGLAGLASTQLALSGHDSLAPASSAYYLAQRIKPYLKPGIPFYSVGTYEQTLPFYIKRPVTLVAFRDELSFGLDQEPRLWVPDIETFARRWLNEDDALAIMAPDTYEQLRKSGLPMQEIARDTRRVVVETLPRDKSKVLS